VVPERTRDLPADFLLTVDARQEGDTLLGGEPFALVRLRPDSAARVRAWRDGAPVGEGGELARALVMANLAQPVPPPAPRRPVTAVIPVRDRPLARLLAALDVDEVIVVDDASEDGDSVRHEAENAGARYIRRDRRGRAGAARNTGLAAASHDVVALIDSDCVPRPGWLEPLLAHLADPEVEIVAPRIVPLAGEAPPRDGRGAEREDAPDERRGAEREYAPRGWRGAAARVLWRYEARRSPLDRGPSAARVVPHGRVSFVPGAALLVRSHVRFDETLKGGEDVDLVWRLDADGHHVRYEPAAQVEHEHRANARYMLARRAYYGRTAAPLAKRHPNHARPLHMSPWTAATYAALATRHPKTAATITATATALLARRLRAARRATRAEDARRARRAGAAQAATQAGGAGEPTWLDDARLAARMVVGGTLGARHIVADAIVRAYWPLALARPRYLVAAAITRSPLATLDALAYGTGVWHGCLAHRTLDPLIPDLTWRMVECDADALIKLAGRA
jgi:mycofactocin glycosyltransferase